MEETTQFIAEFYECITAPENFDLRLMLFVALPFVVMFQIKVFKTFYNMGKK